MKTLLIDIYHLAIVWAGVTFAYIDEHDEACQPEPESDHWEPC